MQPACELKRGISLQRCLSRRGRPPALWRLLLHTSEPPQQSIINPKVTSGCSCLLYIHVLYGSCRASVKQMGKIRNALAIGSLP